MNNLQMNWEEWKPKDIATLVFVFHENDVLLIRKKRGLGKGKINAPGRKVDAGETLEAAAVRELHEEVGIQALSLSYVGDHRFQFVDGYSMHVHVFRTDKFEGIACETEEAIPFWISLDAIPYDEMWEDDRLWIPLMLEEKHFSGKYVFDDSNMLYHDIVVVKDMQ